MKREDLKALGLSDEQIGSVMALHGQTVNDLNSKLTSAHQEATQYQNQLSDNQKELDELKKSAKGNEDLTKQLNDLQEKFNQSKNDSSAKIMEIQKQSAVDLALTQAGAKSLKAAQALLDLDSLKIDEKGIISGLNEQLESIKKENSYLFQDQKAEEAIKTPAFVLGGNPNPQTSVEKTMVQKIQERLGE